MLRQLPGFYVYDQNRLYGPFESARAAGSAGRYFFKETLEDAIFFEVTE